MSKNLRFGQRGEWYVVIQFLLFAVIFFAPLALPGPFDWPAPWDAVGFGLGILLALAGGLIALGGLLSLGGNLTAVPYPKDDAALVERGAYRIVRHPIYSGIIFGSFGWASFHLLRRQVAPRRELALREVS
jgi:protein-S-isoprenylcysteine O-methyltransferase Ste14